MQTMWKRVAPRWRASYQVCCIGAGSASICVWRNWAKADSNNAATYYAPSNESYKQAIIQWIDEYKNHPDRFSFILVCLHSHLTTANLNITNRNFYCLNRDCNSRARRYDRCRYSQPIHSKWKWTRHWELPDVPRK